MLRALFQSHCRGKEELGPHGLHLCGPFTQLIRVWGLTAIITFFTDEEKDDQRPEVLPKYRASNLSAKAQTRSSDPNSQTQE